MPMTWWPSAMPLCGSHVFRVRTAESNVRHWVRRKSSVARSMPGAGSVSLASGWRCPVFVAGRRLARRPGRDWYWSTRASPSPSSTSTSTTTTGRSSAASIWRIATGGSRSSTRGTSTARIPLSGSVTSRSTRCSPMSAGAWCGSVGGSCSPRRRRTSGESAASSRPDSPDSGAERSAPASPDSSLFVRRICTRGSACRVRIRRTNERGRVRQRARAERPYGCAQKANEARSGRMLRAAASVIDQERVSSGTGMRPVRMMRSSSESKSAASSWAESPGQM
jgi:hypothetical protein